MAGTGNADLIISLTAEVSRWLFTWSCQSFLLLGVAWVGLKLDRSRSATTRYRIWLIAILAAALLPLLSALSRNLLSPVVPVMDQVNSTIVVTMPASILQAAQPAFSWPSIIWPALIILWVTGVTVSLLRLGRSLWKIHLIRSGARVISPNDIDCPSSDLFHSNAGVASVALSESIQSPGLAGLFRPVILLPADIASWTSREERMSIFHHELAHIQRRDHFVNLFQSVLTAFFFFHPMVRYACRQLSLERELACDDRVLSLGAEPKAYAVAILKAVERSFLADAVHLMASFNSRRTLERRIDMIMNTDRMRRPLRQWPFLLLPVMLIGVSVWLIVPAAGSQPGTQVSDSQLASNGPASTGSGFSTAGQSQLPPVVNRSTIIVDTVKRGTMLRQVRGLGGLVSGDFGRLKAAIKLPVAVAHDVRIGQPASIDTRHDIISGTVIKVGSEDSRGETLIDISLAGDLPQSAKAGMDVDGAIETERLDNVLYVQRPGIDLEGRVSSLFKLEEGGATATRVRVRYGKISVTVIEILEGLNVGDKVIVSDMSGYAGVNTIRLK